MKLKRLIIQGFKSFKDKTVIHFDKGITGIVGPNGCGKSNIVDALFWVMGEQSAKHLRGSSMQDVIFAGSSKYSPAAWSEVILVLDNEEGKHIHINNTVANPSEIQISRKLYRNGETEYRINNMPCRLKDIQEVFMDTGAGAKSYSIIAQGEINRLVQAKPVERRVMIEEVAGITKFKIRKKESLKKIEQTEANLLRLADLQAEIEKNLSSLKRQAEKAEKAKTLKQKIERNDLTVSSHQEHELLKNYRDGKKILEQKRADVIGWQSRKQSLEISLEEERFKRADLEEQVNELQKEFNTISRELAASEERLKYLQRNKSEKEVLVYKRQDEINELSEERTERETKKEEYAKLKSELESKSSDDFDYSALEEIVDNLKDELQLKTDALSDLESQMKEFNAESARVGQIIFQNESRLETYARSLEDINAEIESLENQYSGVSGAMAEERDTVNRLQKNVEGLTLQEQQIKDGYFKARDELKGLEEQDRDLQKEIIRSESKHQSLIDISTSLDGFKEGVSKFLQTVEDGSYSLLGNLIKCDSKYTKAVTTLLSDLVNVIVSNDSNNANLYDWINQNEDLFLDFIKCDDAKKVSVDTLERIKLIAGEVTPISELLTIPAEFEKIRPLFEGYYVVDTLNKEIFEKISSTISFRAISSLDGKTLIKNSGNSKLLSLTGPTESSAITRNNQIEDLSKLLVSLNERQAELQVALNSARENVTLKSQEWDRLKQALAETKSEFAVKKSTLDAKLSAYDNSTTRLSILKNRKNEISTSRLSLLEEDERLQKKLSEIKQQIDDKGSWLSELKDTQALLKDEYNQKKDELIAKQVEAKTYESRLENYTAQVEDLSKQIIKLDSKIESNKEIIEQYNNDIDLMSDEVDSLSEKNHETASALADKEDTLSTFKDEFAQLLLGMQEREQEVKKLNSELNQTEKKIVEYELKLEQYIAEEEQLVRNIFEKYQVDLRECVGRFLEYTADDFESLKNISNVFYYETEFGKEEIVKQSYEFIKRYTQELRDIEQKLKVQKREYAELGEINWQAIDDYEHQKRRFDFLKTQEIELRTSLTDLQDAIAHIDEKSKERFNVAFSDVSSRFEKVFPIIFGGGSAKLEIIGDINDVECGVDIVAKPPGKKMQNINLMSGGEKAMTAVSLIFSIFLVKPSPFCLLDEVDAPLDDANVGRFNELLREMSTDSQFILITHNKKTMEMNDTLYGVTMQEPGVSKAVSVQLH